MLDLGPLELELWTELDETLDEETDDEDLGLLEELLETLVLEDDSCLLDEDVFGSALFENWMTVFVERE